MPSKVCHESHCDKAIFWPKLNASFSFHQYWGFWTLPKHYKLSIVGQKFLPKHEFLRDFKDNCNLTTNKYPTASASNGFPDFSANVGQATGNIEMKRYRKCIIFDASILHLAVWPLDFFLPDQEQRVDTDFESQMSQTLLFSTQDPRERCELQGITPQDSEVCVDFCLTMLIFCWYTTSHCIMGV